MADTHLNIFFYCLCVLLQVVIIAAGYDSRAYRLGKPGVKFYEIDLPHASEKKQELVKKHMPAEKVRNALTPDRRLCLLLPSCSVYL
jgi:hypothetical protein